ncbi:hypothetical protein B7463_g2362, partial [Scytalidium lignicola]
MSTHLKRNVALTAVGAVGALVAINMNTPPSSRKHQNISSTISAQLDSYNNGSPLSSEVVQQDRRYDDHSEKSKLIKDFEGTCKGLR